MRGSVRRIHISSIRYSRSFVAAPVARKPRMCPPAFGARFAVFPLPDGVKRG
ncbi:hypothetical protein A33K_13824 [Burkholderia humptydooensis MSMB43]|uniref:Uncharacterized protein n=1 Tax=Burkholderia humptydooensis MSMB43 TaxID=441157 RepID=A0ABN0GE38_9BURK|nr:hypothetical protein A33K_13824 [Burkholderia humptydooensis MSMB43]